MTARYIEFMPVSALVAASRNPRQTDIDSLRASVERFGFTVPPILDERTGRLVAGHGRLELLLADMALGSQPPDGLQADAAGSWLVPVMRGWSSKDDREAEAYLLADNRLTEIAGWDEPALLTDLLALVQGPGLVGVGFDTDDIAAFMSTLEKASNSFTIEKVSLPEPEGVLEDPVATVPVTDVAPPRNKQVKSFVLDFPSDQYDFVTEVARRARAHYDEPSNAELFLAMLREWCEANLP